jgi:hypothetical protein
MLNNILNCIRHYCTVAAIKQYLVLLSVSQTCEYQGIDFLGFLRSGEKNINAFASRPRKKQLEGRTASILPT